MNSTCEVCSCWQNHVGKIACAGCILRGHHHETESTRGMWRGCKFTDCHIYTGLFFYESCLVDTAGDVGLRKIACV